MMSLRCVTICAAVLAAASAAPGAPKANVTTLGGESFAGELVSLSAQEAVFTTAAGPRKVPLGDLWQIRLSGYEDLMTVPGRTVVLLHGADGGKLAAKSLTVEEGKVRVATALFGSVAVDVAGVSAIVAPAADEHATACVNRVEAMKLPPGKTDYLVASDKVGRWVPVGGVLKNLQGGKVLFEYRGEDRSVDLATVHALLLAAVPRSGKPPIGQVIAKDGSVVPFASVTLSGSKISLSADGLQIADAALDGIAEINFRSERCTYLSDLEPAKVTQTGLFDVAFPFRRDRSAAGGPLRIAETNYAKGLGLHSRCELTYDLAGKYASFAATAGIDEAGGNRGRATLRILGDGKELLKPTDIAGGAAAISVNLNVAGVKQLTIVVDFGPDNLDVGDYVDLAEARVIKP